jgi:hypothetical protein
MNTGSATVPGLWANLNVPSNSVVIFSSDGGIVNTGVNVGDFVQLDMHLIVDGITLGSTQVGVENGNFLKTGHWSFTTVAVLTAGVHTVRVDAILSGLSSLVPGFFPYAFAGGTPDALTRGTLTAVVLKQ